MGSPKNLDASQSPSAFYGAELRRLREQANLSQDQLGEMVFCSGAYLGQIESAVRKPQMDMSVRLDVVLDTGGLLSRLCELANKTKHADYFADAADLEQQAECIYEFAPLLVPGLLQTEAYADAVMRAAMPTASPAEVKERVQVRLERAKLLSGESRPLYWCVLHETVLRMPVGGPAVMAEQLRHIADAIAERKVFVQLLPYAAGAAGVVGESLYLMRFPDAPPVAYVEGLHTGHLLDDPALVAAYQRSYDFGRAVALSPEASLSLITAAAEEYENEARSGLA